MCRANKETVLTGLDQLFFSPLAQDESAQDRADAIDTFLSANGWTWDDVLKESDDLYQVGN